MDARDLFTQYLINMLGGQMGGFGSGNGGGQFGDYVYSQEGKNLILLTYSA